MKKDVIFPKGYRFDSDMSLFKKAVDYTKQLMDDQSLVIVYEFMADIGIKFLLTESEYNERFAGLSWSEYNDILNSEIIVILEQNYDYPLEIEHDLEEYLKRQGVEDAVNKQICQLKLQKRKYVFSKLHNERDLNRYLLKRKTISPKLSRLDVELAKTVTDNEITYANIRMSTDNYLESMRLPKELVDRIQSKNAKEISFICDKYDLEYLIDELKKIQKRLG